MKQQFKSQQAVDPYNKAVKDAYYKALNATKKLIATIERHELRCTLQREDKSKIGFGVKVHEFISPLLYMSLECNDGDKLSIHFGFELLKDDCEYSHVPAGFVRSLYKFTDSAYTTVNIEDCIDTTYIVSFCREMYENVEDNNHYHTFKLIPYKPATSKRKQHLQVA